MCPADGGWGPDHAPAGAATAARVFFADRLPVAERYAEMLVTDGVVRGLLGPREADRVWERHLLNCAAVAELVPFGVKLIDVGSGAGLPGIVLAVARPDLRITLVEPMARRVTFLIEAVTALGIADRVTVERCRAGEAVDRIPPAEVVTARALARLDQLAKWCLPLTAPDGRVLALKGASAPEEVATHRDAVIRSGGDEPVVRQCGTGLIDPPAVVVEIPRRSPPPGSPSEPSPPSGRGVAGGGRRRRGRRGGGRGNSGGSGHGRSGPGRPARVRATPATR